jgi:hypothetical protein
MFPVFSIGLGVLFLFSAVSLYRNSKTLDEWQITRGRILKSQIKQNGIAYAPEIRFQYEVEGVERIGLSVNMNGKQTFKRSVAQEWIAPYPVGKEVDVYYNPRKTRMAVLEKNISMGSLITVAGLGIILIMMGFLNFFD